jgi:hypothetical protein
MKAACLSMLVLTSLQVVVWGQKLHFTDSTNKWEINIPSLAGGPCYQCRTSYSFKTDIVLNGITYRHLTNLADSILIREDTSLGKVFARVYDYNQSIPDTGEFLLYDYNLQVGDTFYGGHPQFRHVVDSVMIVTVGNSPQRAWHLSSIPPGSSIAYWVVEGIGCLTDPLYPFWPFLFEETRQLYCFTTNSLTPYITPAISTVDFCCVLTPVNYQTQTYPYHNSNTCAIVSVESMKPSASSITVFPQPAGEEVSFRLPGILAAGKVTILNAEGTIVYSATLSGTDRFTVKRPGPTGVYFYKLTDLASAATSHGKLLFH